MTRKEAKQKGLKHYHGKACKACGKTLKYTSNWTCVYCERNRVNSRDPEIYKKYIQSQKGQSWLKNYRKTKTYRDVQNRWVNESGFGRYQQVRRRKQVKESVSNLSEKEISQIKQIYKEAARLTQETNIMHHVDHIVPLYKGGTHEPHNLQILTIDDHIEKTKEDLNEGSTFDRHSPRSEK